MSFNFERSEWLLDLSHLLQLASPGLPVGAYSYSEGLETLVDRGAIASRPALAQWLWREISGGAIRLEAAVMVRAARAWRGGDRASVRAWNDWLSAARETRELREQSWQMGRSLWQLLAAWGVALDGEDLGMQCNYAIAFGVAVGARNLDEAAVVLAYLQAWTTNAIAAGVKLIPLGQTAGSQVLWEARSHWVAATAEILALGDEELFSCTWGLVLASMAHESQYVRLFRS